MAFTQTQLDTLETAIADGVLSVQYADKRVTYRSLDEMLKLRDAMRRDLGLSPSGRIYHSPSKGLP
jgi:hypothetical protein